MNRREAAAAELEKWWLDHAQKQVEKTVPKAVEYGSDDLRDLGAWLADSMGMTYQLTDGQLVQLGITMYLRGKMARIVSAIKDGREPSTDTWFDLVVYSMMGQRAHEFGAWPGVDLDALELEAGPEWRECCHTIKGLDHLKECPTEQAAAQADDRRVRGEQTICTCVSQDYPTIDPGCPTHGCFESEQPV